MTNMRPGVMKRVVDSASMATAALALTGAGCVAARSGSVPSGLQPWDASCAGAPGEVRGERLQTFIENARCYAGLPRYAHKPDFRIVPVRERKYRGKYFWFLDGEQKIGLLNLSFGEIEMFRFFPPAGGVPVEYEMPAVHGWATLQGPRITIVPQGTWTNNGRMAACLRDGGESLRLRYTEKSGGNTEMVHWFTLRFDPVLGYIWDCVFEMQMDKPRRFEYSNLLAAGLADSRDERKRYQKCIWTRRDGTLCYMYQNPRSMMQSSGSEWTDMPEDGGFVGFVAEPDANPFLEIVRSEPATTFVTCSVWYDQHVIALEPEQKGEDGRYRVTAAYRLLSLPLQVAKELEDAARTMLPPSGGDGPMGFRQGIVNDFETLVPAGTLFNGCIWGHSAKYDGTTGHSGTHSLRISGSETAQPIHGGPLIHVEPGRRYRLSVWARTRGATGKGAYVRVNEIGSKWPEARVSHRSRRLAGDTDWTQLRIEFRPLAGDLFAVPGLVLEGGGNAWFDDIELVELPR